MSDLAIKGGSVRVPDGAPIEVHPPDFNSGRWSIRLGDGALWLHMSAETLYAFQLAIARARDVARTRRGSARADMHIHQDDNAPAGAGGTT